MSEVVDRENIYCYLFLFLVTVEVVGRLYHFIEDWCKYFGTPEALEVSMKKYCSYNSGFFIFLGACNNFNITL